VPCWPEVLIFAWLRLCKSQDKTVPIFVPTPRIEALRAVASSLLGNAWKSLKTSNLAQCLAIIGSVAKSLKVRGFLVRDQEVGGSNPLAPTIIHCIFIEFKRLEPFGLQPLFGPFARNWPHPRPSVGTRRKPEVLSGPASRPLCGLRF